MVKYQLPIGNGAIKRSKKYESLKPLQKEVYDKVYDPVNGVLFFAENCAYVNRNGIQRYEPFDYQKEMLFNLLNYQNVLSLFSRQNGKCFFSEMQLKVVNKKTKEEKNITVKQLFDIIKKQNEK